VKLKVEKMIARRQIAAISERQKIKNAKYVRILAGLLSEDNIAKLVA